MRAEVGEGEADKRLPPVKGWEFHTTSGWCSEDQTLECSRHPSAESAGQFVRQNNAMFILKLIVEPRAIMEIQL